MAVSLLISSASKGRPCPCKRDVPNLRKPMTSYWYTCTEPCWHVKQHFVYLDIRQTNQFRHFIQSLVILSSEVLIEGHYDIECRRRRPKAPPRAWDSGVFRGFEAFELKSLESLRAKGFNLLSFLETDDITLGFFGGLSSTSCFIIAWSFSKSVNLIRIRASSSFSSRFIFLWKFSIDVLDLDMPFNCNAEISEPFKMKFIWGLQFWALTGGVLRCWISCELQV